LDRALAELQGASGELIAWQVAGPLTASAASAVVSQVARPSRVPEPSAGSAGEWQSRLATSTETPLRVGAGKGPTGAAIWLAFTDLDVPEATAGQFLLSAKDGLRVWLNGRLIHERDAPRTLAQSLVRPDVRLSRGANRLLVEIMSSSQPVELHARFRRQSASANHERLMSAALTTVGDATRGRKLFLDAGKSQCLSCHRLGDRGERIGPELTGIGARFSRVFIAESILEPSRTIAPSFETVMVALNDGRVLTGVRTAETDQSLTLADQQGQKHLLAKSSIEERRPQPQSTMPDGLEQRFTPGEFIDLIEFLVSAK
jgi:putative heme-binding domain-containing protein